MLAHELDKILNTTNKIMGQAKRRGTYEERVQQSITEQNFVRELLEKQEKEWWDSLTPEEQETVTRNREIAKQRRERAAMITRAFSRFA